MESERLNRRQFLCLAGALGGATVLSACAPATPETIVVKETVVVAGEEQVREVEVEKVVTATPGPVLTTVVVNAYTPSEWSERSAEHPTVTNAPRILAEKFKEVEPDIEIQWLRYTGSPAGTAGDTYYAAWCQALVAAGNEPDIISPLHEIPIQMGYCLPINEYLQMPSYYAPQYPTWYDSFQKTVMDSLVFGDGNTYCAPIQQKLAGFEIGMMCNMDWFDRIGMTPPKTWSEQVAVGAALKEAGSGWVPWPPEAAEGNIWALGLQLLPSILQPECVEMDLNNDFFINNDEAVEGLAKRLIGGTTPKYQAGWEQQRLVSTHWMDGWESADLEVMWRNGQVGMRQTGGWEFVAQKSDPQMEFERVLVPPASVSAADLPDATDPPAWTAGDGKIPPNMLTAINGPDTAVMKVAVDRGTVEGAIKWLMWITEPENNSFLVNENEEQLPCAKDASLGPLWTELLSSPMPRYDYQIAWWGEGLQYDNTCFNEVRKLFVAWATGQMNDSTFFQRQQEEMEAGAQRYTEALNALTE